MVEGTADRQRWANDGHRHSSCLLYQRIRFSELRAPASRQVTSWGNPLACLEKERDALLTRYTFDRRGCLGR